MLKLLYELYKINIDIISVYESTSLDCFIFDLL